MQISKVKQSNLNESNVVQSIVDLSINVMWYVESNVRKLLRQLLVCQLSPANLTWEDGRVCL